MLLLTGGGGVAFAFAIGHYARRYVHLDRDLALPGFVLAGLGALTVLLWFLGHREGRIRRKTRVLLLFLAALLAAALLIAHGAALLGLLGSAGHLLWTVRASITVATLPELADFLGLVMGGTAYLGLVSWLMLRLFRDSGGSIDRMFAEAASRAKAKAAQREPAQGGRGEQRQGN